MLVIFVPDKEAGSNEEEVVAEEIASIPKDKLEPLIAEIRELRSALERREFSASVIALIVVTGFFALLFVPLVYLFIAQPPVSDIVDLIKTISAVLSGIVGSVMGYYFRGVREEERGKEENGEEEKSQ